MQTLRAHSWRVLTAPEFSFAEKLSFFQFAGFYCLQSILLAYLCFVLLVVPFDGAKCDNFMFSADKPSCIVAVMPDKSVYTVSDKQLNAVRDRKPTEFTFNMESRKEKFTSGRKLERIMREVI